MQKQQQSGRKVNSLATMVVAVLMVVVATDCCDNQCDSFVCC